MAWSDPVASYCERLAPGLLGEPLNPSANIAFAAAAVALLRLHARLQARGDDCPLTSARYPGWCSALPSVVYCSTRSPSAGPAGSIVFRFCLLRARGVQLRTPRHRSGNAIAAHSCSVCGGELQLEPTASARHAERIGRLFSELAHVACRHCVSARTTSSRISQLCTGQSASSRPR